MFKTPKEMVMSGIAIGVVGSCCLAFLLPVFSPLVTSIVVPQVIEGPAFTNIVTMILSFYFGIKATAMKSG
jgi:hypothetical protein